MRGCRELRSYQHLELDDLLRRRSVSASWQRVLLERLDTLAVIYRLAAAASNIVVSHQRPPLPSGARRRRSHTS